MFLKYFKVLLLFSIPVLLIACSTQNQTVKQTTNQANQQNYILNYKGESNHWSAVLEENVTDYGGGKSKDYSKFTLTYKGTDIKAVGKVNFSYSATWDGSKGTDFTLSPDGKIVSNGGGVNAALPIKDGVVKVTVEWNGKKETFNLTDKKDVK